MLTERLDLFLEKYQYLWRYFFLPVWLLAESQDKVLQADFLKIQSIRSISNYLIKTWNNTSLQIPIVTPNAHNLLNKNGIFSSSKKGRSHDKKVLFVFPLD